MQCRGQTVFLCLSVLLSLASADNFGAGLKLLGRVYDSCESSKEILKCFKVNAAKLVDRASRMETLPILDGISLVRRSDLGRAFPSSLPEGDLNTLPSEQVDKYLNLATSKLMQTHRVVLSPTTIGTDVARSMDEARGKLKKMIGPILAGVAIKGGFLAIAFQAIALIAGKALLIGKIALLLSAIIGLKKLVSGGESHEKTTYEIVKHPQVSQSHTYSSSHYGGDFDATGPGGHYRRSVEDEAAAQDRAYRAYAAKQQ
ncbi:uncharacterized protein LOC106130657 [Amyelois transitella]|uniref:uncharacterized protein LOC106130657 n=1 Tax=Amyelois transitella TaxID=680683 RepID=UPI00067E1F01|nr:uncharacterized protein LOC106130657 [Amyelois transitella]